MEYVFVCLCVVSVSASLCSEHVSVNLCFYLSVCISRSVCVSVSVCHCVGVCVLVYEGKIYSFFMSAF